MIANDKNLPLTRVGKKRDRALVSFSLKADPETRMGVQVAYLGTSPGSTHGVGWGSDSRQGRRSLWGVSAWGVCRSRAVTANRLQTWHLHVAFLGVISQVMEVTLKKGRVAAWLQGLTPQISLPISVSDFAYHLSFLLLGTGFLRK